MSLMMPTLRSMSSNHDPALEEKLLEACPAACLEEKIETEKSFTTVTDEGHDRAWKLWQLPEGRRKEDAVFVEFFYKTLDLILC